MSAILKGRWTQQPSGPVAVNPRIQDRISLLVLPGQMQGDAISGVIGTVQGSTRVITAHGHALRRSASPAAGDGYYFTGAKPSLSAPYTIVVLAKSAAEAKRSAWFFLGNENSSPFPQIHFGPNTSRGAAASSGTLGFFEYSGGFLASADATSQIDGDWHVFAVVRPAGTVAPRLYRDGKQLTLAGSTTNASIPATSAFAPYIGGTNYTTADRTPEGDIAGVAVYRGELPEIPGTPQAFWATFLAPTVKRIYFTAPAGGVTASLTGVSSTTAVGALSTSAGVTQSLTGVSSSSGIGSLSVGAGASSTLSGVASVTAVGTLVADASGAVSVALSGLASTTAVGVLSTSVGVNVTLSGRSSTSGVGSLSTSIGYGVVLSGVSATASVGSLSTVSNVNQTINGVSATCSVGSLVASVEGVVPNASRRRITLINRVDRSSLVRRVSRKTII